MARASASQLAFTGGILSPLVSARVDVDRYAIGASEMVNFVPLLEGPMTKRPGSKFIQKSKYPDKRSILLPFVFSKTQSFQLEFGDKYFRVHDESGTLLDVDEIVLFSVTDTNPVVAQVVIGQEIVRQSSKIFIRGSLQTELNNRFFDVTVLDPVQFTVQLDGEDGTGRFTGIETTGATAGVVFEAVTPYLEADLDKISVSQVGDQLYITCEGYRPAIITRLSDGEKAIYDPLPEIVPPSWVYREERFAYPQSPTAATFAQEADLTDPVNIQHEAHGFATNDIVYMNQFRMVELNDRFFKITVIDVDNYELDDEDGTGRVLDVITYLQNRVERFAEALAPSPKIGPPFNPLNRTDIQIHYISVSSTLNASSDLFTDAMVGMFVKVQNTEIDFGYGFIQQVVSPTVVDIVQALGNDFPGAVTGVNNATVNWAFEAFSPISNYPRAGNFLEGRYWIGGTDEFPVTAWASNTFQFRNFITYDSSGAPAAITVTSGLVLTLDTDRLDPITWFHGTAPMVMGTRSGEYAVEAKNTDEGLSQGNTSIRLKSSYGSRVEVKPILIDSVMMFVQASGRKIREWVYQFESDRYVAPNMNQLVRELSESGISQMAWASEPSRALFVRMQNGRLASFTYERNESIAAWSTIELGGTDVGVESVSVIPADTRDSSDLWMVVRRTVNGVVQRHIELFKERWTSTNDVQESWFLDAALSFSGAPTTAFAGLQHLSGESVTVVADGVVLSELHLVDEIGQITLKEAASDVIAGLPYNSRFASMDIEAGAETGLSQGQTKKVGKCVLRLSDTGPGLFFGGNGDRLDEIGFRDLDEMGDFPVPPFSGDIKRQTVPGGYAREARLYIEHRLPLPCTVIAAFMKIETKEN